MSLCSHQIVNKKGTFKLPTWFDFHTELRYFCHRC